MKNGTQIKLLRDFPRLGLKAGDIGQVRRKLPQTNTGYGEQLFEITILSIERRELFELIVIKEWIDDTGKD